MAVVSVNEIADDRGAGADQSIYSYSRHFQVVVNDVNDGPEVARTANGVPRVGDVYTAGSFAWARNVRVEPENSSRLVWRVDVGYETSPRTGNTGDDNPNPLLRPAQYEWGVVTGNEVFRHGKFTKKITLTYQEGGANDEYATASRFAARKRYPVQNSALQPFSPPPERRSSYPRLRVTRNQSSFNPVDIVSYIDATNSDQFMVAGAIVTKGQAMMSDIAAVRQFENETWFWQVSYDLHFKQEGWDLQILDQGARERVQDNGNPPKWVLKEITNKDGTPSGVVPLDGNGRAIQFKDPPANNDVLGVFLVYEWPKQAVFGSLLL